MNIFTNSRKIGTLVATAESPSTTKIHFVLKDETVQVSRGELVEISSSGEESQKRLALAQIQEILKLNRYYASVDSVKIYEDGARSLDSIFPTDEWTYSLCEAKPLGELKMDQVFRMDFPLSPGATVSRARTQIIQKFLGLKPPGQGLHLGTITTANTPLVADLARLLHKHLAILAISGAGKSYTCAVVLEELMKRTKEEGRLAVAVIDPHGEYGNLGEVFANAETVLGSYVQIAVHTLNAYDFADFLPNITPVQIRELAKILRTLKKPYGLPEIARAIEEAEMGGRTKEALQSWIYSLQDTQVFGVSENPVFNTLLTPGKLVVFDLSDIYSMNQKAILVTYIAKRLFNLRRRQSIPPFMLLVEEAHQFCPEGASSLPKRIIETIAREGRKFYACLCLVSQRPVRLSATALSQCNSNLIMRIRNPYDLDFIARTSEGIDRSSLNQLPDLDVGEALLLGNAVRFPVFFRVRPRETKVKFEMSLEEVAKLYEE
ncbi:MAG: ATP-binding protein [Candidatus Hodarchaeota archaeon]